MKIFTLQIFTAISFSILVPAIAGAKVTEAKIIEVCSAKKEVCKCVAKTHADAAKNELKREDREAHMKWVLAFYKSTDPAELKKLSEENPALSQFDEQVARDCTKAN